ncbi:hypothetical protein [Pseudalkalibacillus sp. NRS-1564]
MKKADIQELYKKVKRTRRTRKSRPTQIKGCRTCGKTNWKPNTQ